MIFSAFHIKFDGGKRGHFPKLVDPPKVSTTKLWRRVKRRRSLKNNAKMVISQAPSSFPG